MRLRHLFVISMCLLMAATATAQQKKVREGKPAPGLDVETWINGSETTIQPERVYLIAFVNLEEKRSQDIVPALSMAQRELGWMGLTVIAVTKQSQRDLSRWMRSNGDKVEFTIAVDRRNGSYSAWMSGSGQKNMPTVFLVGKRSRVQYIGDLASERFREIMPLVMDGRYDASLNRQAEPIVEQAKQARKMRNWRMCFKMLDDVIQSEPRIFAYHTLTKFEIMLVDQSDRAAAYEFADELIIEYADDPSVLAKLAEKIATDPKIEDEKRDMEVAMKAAKAAFEATDPDDPERYAILALVNYHSGNHREAIKLQKKAYLIARPVRKPHHKRLLETYQEGEERQASIKSKTG